MSCWFFFRISSIFFKASISLFCSSFSLLFKGLIQFVDSRFCLCNCKFSKVLWEDDFVSCSIFSMYSKYLLYIFPPFFLLWTDFLIYPIILYSWYSSNMLLNTFLSNSKLNESCSFNSNQLSNWFFLAFLFHSRITPFSFSISASGKVEFK